MDLYFYTGRLDLAATSLADLQALITALADEADAENAATIARVTGKVPPLVQSDSGEALRLYFYSDSSTPASWVTDAAVTLAIGLGLPDPDSGSLYSSTTTTSISGSARLATLALNTAALEAALTAYGPRAPYTLHLRKTESGVTETVGLLRMRVLPGVLSTAPAGDGSVSYVDSDTLLASTVLNKAGLTSLTGGGTTALDGLPTAAGTTGRLPVGCVVLTALNDLPQHWRLKSGTTAEDGLTVIRPDDYHATTNAVYWQLLA